MKIISLNKDENENIKLACKNNRQAQQLIYSKHAPKMLGVCRQYIKDLQLAEDVLITAFMKVFVNLENFENKGSFEGRIRRIMVNECIGYLRVKKEIEFIEDENYFTESYNNTESIFSINDIQFLIDQLPDGYKMIFNLYCIEGYKHHEIAKMLNINEGTSKSQLSHARRILQQQILKSKNFENGIQ